VFKGQTVRLLIANAGALKDKKPIIDRFMKAYRETVDFMYSDPKALEIFAEFNGIPVEIAKRTRDGFFPRTAVDPDTIVGLNIVMPDAVEMKYISSALTDAQVKEMIQIPPK
jgi:NitT/TauT family transport system substrate-binding protein